MAVLRKRTAGEIEAASMKDPESAETTISINTKDLIPSGSTLLNCALADNPYAGWSVGKISNLVGDTFTGKSLLALSMLAEICQESRFDKYDLIYSDDEQAMEFDIKYLFGKKLLDRIELRVESNACETVEDMERAILKELNKGKPFIYINDSFDAISSEAEIARKKKQQTDEENKKGSFKLEKPKLAGEMLRTIDKGLSESRSFVFVISQTRSKIGPAAIFGNPKTRSGGDALHFWCCHEVWLMKGKDIKKKDRPIGSNVLLSVAKNKVTGKRRKINIPIYTDYGVDDIGSCIDFLVDEGHWEKEGNTIVAAEFNLEGTRNRIISGIESHELEKDLQQLVGNKWNEIEESLKLGRKRKYE